MEKNLNHGWKFYYGNPEESYRSPWDRGYDDSSWQSIQVPHDWAVTMPFSREHSSGTGYLAGGTGWYRLHFHLPKDWEGKHVILQFDGVYKCSQVWCNSNYLGNWANGYLGFSFDISSVAHYGDEENVIAVKVNHEDVADSRSYTGSGINRKVRVLMKEALHIKENGVFFQSNNVEETQAEITVQSSIKNTTQETKVVELVQELIDSSGKIVFSMETEEEIKGMESLTITQEGEVVKPILWSVENPYLYTLKTSLKYDGVIQDENNTKVGIRSFHFDPDEGFSLNGVSMKLKGVCLHEDAGCLGSAVHKAVWRRRLNKLKDMGCNAIRMSHNPHLPELYDLCDEMGFFVFDEIYDEWVIPKKKWSRGHNVYPPKYQGYAEHFPQWHEKDIEAFILKNRNHPCIILWSIGNEIDYPNDPYSYPLIAELGQWDMNKPAEETIYDPHRPNAEQLAKLTSYLVALVKKYDTSRPVSLASAFPEVSSRVGMLDSLDVVGYNYKEHLYEEDHKRFPDKPFVGSENGHSLEAWRAVTDNKFIAGQFLWTGIDYLGETIGWPVHGSNAGNMTLAGFEKPRYYFRQSLWSNEPMVYIVTARADDLKEFQNEKEKHSDWMRERWDYVHGEDITVHIYSNQPSVQLFLNDKCIGNYEINEELGYAVCNVTFEPGELRAETINNTKTSGDNVVHRLVSTGVPCDIDTRVIRYEDPLEADIVQIEVQLLDGAGRKVKCADSLLHVETEGNVKLLGIESGDLADNTDYSASFRKTYNGQLLIILQIMHEDGQEMYKSMNNNVETGSLHKAETAVIIHGDGISRKRILL